MLLWNPVVKYTLLTCKMAIKVKCMLILGSGHNSKLIAPVVNNVACISLINLLVKSLTKKMCCVV